MIKLETGNRDHYREVRAPRHLRSGACGDPLSAGAAVCFSGFMPGACTVPRTPSVSRRRWSCWANCRWQSERQPASSRASKRRSPIQPTGDLNRPIAMRRAAEAAQSRLHYSCVSALNLVNEERLCRALPRGQPPTINLTPGPIAKKTIAFFISVPLHHARATVKEADRTAGIARQHGQHHGNA